VHGVPGVYAYTKILRLTITPYDASSAIQLNTVVCATAESACTFLLVVIIIIVIIIIIIATGL